MISFFKSYWRQQVFILLIIVMAAWLRLWRLNSIPPGLWYDEAYNAMDTVWMLQTQSPQLFFISNNGREPLYHYLVAAGMLLFGEKVYVLRLVSAGSGLITVPLMYRWLLNLFAERSDRGWLALLGAAGLAFSYWHVTISRTGFRAILLPLFVILTLHFFWLGWRQGAWRYFILAGISLGLSQYVYLSARLLPLILVLAVLVLTVSVRRISHRTLWLGLGMTAVVSMLVFVPLGYFFLDHWELFSERSEQVSLWHEISEGKTTLSEQILTALSVFGSGADGNWRHDLPDHASFNWLMIFGLWMGLIVAIKNFKWPYSLPLLIGLLVMWLPALLSVPAIHALRLLGILPFYYGLAALGLANVFNRLTRGVARPNTLAVVVFGLLVVVNSGSTTFDYFYRWADQPGVYAEYEAHLADLAQILLAEAAHRDVLMPFALYEHPAMRFFLHPTFPETHIPPEALQSRPGLLVETTTYLARRSNGSSYVWLNRDQTGHNKAYVSLQPQASSPQLIPTGRAVTFVDPATGQPLATLTPVETIMPALPWFTQWPANSRRMNQKTWLQKVQLVGYSFSPNPVLPGQTLDVQLNWQLLHPDFNWNFSVEVELIDSQGKAISESKISAKELFSWREAGVATSSQHLIYISPELFPGPYIVRMKLLSGNRPVPTDDGVEITTLGLAYVGAEDFDLRQPPKVVSGQFNNAVTLLGYAPPLPLGENLFRGKLYWQAQQPLTQNFIPFVRLLDSSGTAIYNWEAPPLHNMYPTILWHPGETIVDEFDLHLPAKLESGSYPLVAGLIDPATGWPVPPGNIVLEVINIP